jgi:hypothetical protein
VLVSMFVSLSVFDRLTCEYLEFSTTKDERVAKEDERRQPHTSLRSARFVPEQLWDYAIEYK